MAPRKRKKAVALIVDEENARWIERDLKWHLALPGGLGRLGIEVEMVVVDWCAQCQDPNLKGLHTCGKGLNEEDEDDNGPDDERPCSCGDRSRPFINHRVRIPCWTYIGHERLDVDTAGRIIFPEEEGA